MSDRPHRKTGRGSKSTKTVALITALEQGWTRNVVRAFQTRFAAKLDINSLFLLDPELYERSDGRTITTEQKAYLDGYQQGYFAACNKAAEVITAHLSKLGMKECNKE